MRKIISTLVAALSVAAVTAAPVKAQQFPQREIRFIVGFSPGGAADMQARMLQSLIEKRSGVKVIVENMPGGSSIVAMGAVSRAKPDGYTLGSGSTSLVGYLAAPVGGPPLKTTSFDYISYINEEPLLLAVSEKSPWKTYAEFATYVKEQKGAATLGSAGAERGIPHVLTNLLGEPLGTTMRYIPYPGASRAVVDLLGGQVNAVIAKPAEVLSFVEGKQARVLGIFGDARLDVMPDVPTFKELGVDVYKFGALTSLGYVVAPAGLPGPVRDKLVAIFKDAVDSEEFRSFSAKNGLVGRDYHGDGLRKHIEEQAAAWTKVNSVMFPGQQ